MNNVNLAPTFTEERDSHGFLVPTRQRERLVFKTGEYRLTGDQLRQLLPAGGDQIMVDRLYGDGNLKERVVVEDGIGIDGTGVDQESGSGGKLRVFYGVKSVFGEPVTEKRVDDFAPIQDGDDGEQKVRVRVDDKTEPGMRAVHMDYRVRVKGRHSGDEKRYATREKVIRFAHTPVSPQF